MYVTTFYSFKGGVGRTMSLVNTGVELARRGRKVLLVDFDLEAPGLDTFEAIKPKRTAPGIVDFVRRYLDTGQAPEVAEFLEKCPEIGDDGGELWLMPAGASKSNYAESFRQIDWGNLYEQRNGYILFEDLKAQWEEVLQPDYVLIDSRTGHTDVGGICTRQLPDSVAMLFFPNEQNLTGLTKVVADIRSESEEPRGKQIHLHFIMSNVPDLDDEDRILEKKIIAFQNMLQFERDPLIVHRYDSLSLLNQVVFTKDRPRSRLAEEYRKIVTEIVSQNLEDREGALEYLKKFQRAVHSDPFRNESSEESNQKLLKIGNLHEKDGEVLFRLGVLRQEQWEPKQAASLFGRATERGYSKPQVHMRRARVLSDSGQVNEASAEALRALQSADLSPRLIRQALMLVDPNESSRAVESPAIASLSTLDRINLAHDVFFETPMLRDAALRILIAVTEDPELEVQPSQERNDLVLVYIATGQFNAAIDLLDYERIEDVDIRTAFNYAMASWGARGSTDTQAFNAVIQLYEAQDESDRLSDANYLQCIALAYWVIEDTVQATEYVNEALEAVDPHGQTFSCWRYCNVSASEFKKDIGEMIEYFSGNILMTPPFISK